MKKMILCRKDGVLVVTLRVVFSPHPDDSVRMISQPHDAPEGQGVFSCGLSYISTKEVDEEMARALFAATFPDYEEEGFYLECIDASHVEVRTEHLPARLVLDRFGPLGDTDDVLCKLREGDSLVPYQLNPEASEANRNLLIMLNGWMILTPV